VPNDEITELIKQNRISKLKNEVATEVDSKVKPMILKDYPNATPEFLEEVKAQITELAFTSDFNTYRIEDIYKVNRDKFIFQDNYTAEPSGGKASEYVNYDTMSEDDAL